MNKIIKQSVLLPASPRELYAQYLNSKAHGAITGGKVLISPRIGSRFDAFGGMLTGRVLDLIPGRLIVQAWRSGIFKKADLDSTLVLRFSAKGKGACIDLVHVNVPDHDYRGVNAGWRKYYWKPWLEYLTS